MAVLSLTCHDGRFPSVGRLYPAAIRPERAIQDLVGLVAEGCPDPRPWLDHGRWSVGHPLSGRSEPAQRLEPYTFLPVEGANLHQIPVGPVHAGIIEPGHFRFTACGETVARLEERLGYVHKGIERLMMGRSPWDAARFAGRASGDSTVAYAWAFARAVEAAMGYQVKDHTSALRAVMAELERLANHLGDIGAICNDASFALMQAHTAVLRERVLRASQEAFGHRLMMDLIVPGGLARGMASSGPSAVRAALDCIESSFPALVELYDNTTSLQDRTAETGFVSIELARLFAPGGVVGRASGRHVDARRQPGYPPYDTLDFDVPVRVDGDVNSRVWIRILEVTQSIRLIRQLLDRLPGRSGDTEIAPLAPSGPGEGAAMVEGFRGDVFVWLRLDGDGRVARCHLRDPSWFQWPVLEAAIEGNIVADFPLCNKSFNCSYSGHDL
ncbi:MAG: NADH-quinone oxidoreductase subunit C [Pseudomonadota bacterium]